jgi:hypothetical protein
MDLCEFQGRTFGKLNNHVFKGHIFVLEPSWDNFRPIEYVGWNGTKFEIVDKKFKQNLFDSNYGYGSAEMKKACSKLLEQTPIENTKELSPQQFWVWCGHKTQWWRDRECLFSSPCVVPSIESWKTLVHITHSKAKTLKQKVRHHLTRRVKGLVSK